MKTTSKHCSIFNLDSSETVMYNNPLFPAYVRYEILSTYPDHSAISHWHEDLEFILVKEGTMTYNVNGELIELTRGNGIMVNSRQLHYGFSAKHNECEFICVLLSPELLRGNEWFYHNGIERITTNPACPYLYLTAGGWQKMILDQVEHLYRIFGSCTETARNTGRIPNMAQKTDALDRLSDAGNADTDSIANVPGITCCFELMQHFAEIMKILYKNLNLQNSVTARESSELTALRNMITYVEKHFAQHIALEQIALSGACCKSRCSLLFKKYLRETPITYVTKLRLRKSLIALLESDKNITEIAYECGFGGASYYCETFQKYYGTSPLKYRKKTSRARLRDSLRELG